MRRRLTVAVLVSSLVAVTGFAGPGNAGVKLQYSRAYTAAGKRCGDKTAPGRHVYHEGSTLSNGKKVTPAMYRRLTAKLESMCQPLPVPSAVQVATTATPAPAASGSCPAVIPGYIIQKESGGDPGAVNSSTGAYGCYQIMPMHYAPGGECADLDRSVAGQAACAQRLPSSAWAETR